MVFTEVASMQRGPEDDVRGRILSNETLVDIAVPSAANRSTTYRTSSFQLDDPSRRELVVENDLVGMDHESLGIWISPDGRHAVALRSTSIPPEPNMRDLQFVLFDLMSSTRRALVEAPVGWITRHSGPVKAIWLSNERVILSNTGILLGLTGLESSVRPDGSYVVDVNLASGRVAPIVQLPIAMNRDQLWVRDVEYDPSQRTLAIRSSNVEGYKPVEFYKDFGFGTWRRLGDQEDVHTPAVHQGPNAPPAFVLSCDRRQSTRIDLNPWLKGYAETRSEPVEWRDATGMLWRGGLLFPAGYVEGKRYPLVIQTHGYNAGEFLVDGPDGWMTGFAARPIAGAGMFVLQIEDRLDLMSNVGEGDAMTRSYESAIAALNRRGLIDANKVGVIGFSRTAYHVKYALTHRPDLFSAAAIADGSDHGYMQYLAWYHHNIPPSGSTATYERLNGGNPFLNIQAWLQSAPGFMLESVRAPVRILIPNTPSALSEWEWWVGLRRLNRPVEAVFTNAGAHPDPAKKEQYARWRHMREEAAVRRALPNTSTSAKSPMH